MMNLLIEQLMQEIPSTSLKDLKLILSRVKSEITKRSQNLSGYIEYVPNFCSDEYTLDAVWKECESLHLPDSSRKAHSQWLSPVNEPYIYPDTNPIHDAEDITQFPAILNIMEMINNIPGIQGPMNSCLILKYNSDSTSLSPHSDDEGDIIDQSKAICNYST